MTASLKTIIKKAFIIIIVPFLLTMILLVFLNIKQEAVAVRDDRIYSGWSIEALGQTYKDVNLLDFNLSPMPKRGESIVLKKTLEGSGVAMGLDIEAYFTAIRVFLEDRILYEYGVDNISTGDYVGYGIHFVELGDDLEGKTLTLEYYPGEDSRINSLPSLIYVPAAHLFTTYFGEKSLQIFLGVFSFFTGWVLLFIGTYGLNKNPNYICLIMTAVAAIIGGLWLTSSVGGLEIFSKDISTNSKLEYISFVILPIPILFLSLFMKKNLRKPEKAALISCIGLNNILIIIGYAAHETNKMHFCIFVQYYMWFLLFFVLIAALLGIRKSIAMTRSEIVFEAAFIGVVLIAILEAIRYMGVEVLGMVDFPLLQDSIMFYGIPIFLLILVYSFITLISETGEEAYLESFSEKDSFKDYNNDIYTQKRIPKLLRELEDYPGEYAILRFSLAKNGTEEETYANICNFSNYLKRAYPTEQDIVLESENAFTVVVHGDIKDIETKGYDKLRNIIKAMGSNISFSAGMANNKEETGITPNRIYELAGLRIK